VRDTGDTRRSVLPRLSGAGVPVGAGPQTFGRSGPPGTGRNTVGCRWCRFFLLFPKLRGRKPAPSAPNRVLYAPDAARRVPTPGADQGANQRIAGTRSSASLYTGCRPWVPAILQQAAPANLFSGCQLSSGRHPGWHPPRRYNAARVPAPGANYPPNNRHLLTYTLPDGGWGR
jgi:hypothetical protein